MWAARRKKLISTQASVTENLYEILHELRTELEPEPSVIQAISRLRVSLVIFGGEVIRSFSLAMIWGICVATYSSVFICSPMLIYLGLRNVSAEPAPTPDAKDSKAKPGAVKTA